DWRFRGAVLYGYQLVGDPGRGNHVALVVLPTVGSIRSDRFAFALQSGCCWDARRRRNGGTRADWWVLVAMWNYMGWDNVSTIAQEVERPQRTYPRAMIAAVILVALTYILPFAAVYVAGVPASAFAAEGSWAQVAGMVAGTWRGLNWLGFLLVLGGMMSGFGMFNA